MKSSTRAVLGFCFLLLDPAGALRAQKVIANATTVGNSKRGPLTVNKKVSDMITYVQKIWATTNSACGVGGIAVSRFFDPPGLADELSLWHDRLDDILSVSTAVATVVLLWIPGPIKDEWAAIFSTIMDNSVRTVLFAFYVVNWFNYGKVYLGWMRGDEDIEKNFRIFCESIDLDQEKLTGAFFKKKKVTDSKQEEIVEGVPLNAIFKKKKDVTDSKQEEIPEAVPLTPSQIELLERGETYCAMMTLSTEEERDKFGRQDILNAKLRNAVDSLSKGTTKEDEPIAKAFDDPDNGLGHLGDFNLTKAITKYEESKVYTWGTLTPLIQKFCSSFTAFYNGIVSLCLPCITGLPGYVNKTKEKNGTIFSQSDVSEKDCHQHCGIQCAAVSLTWNPGVCGSYNKNKRSEYWKTEAY